MATQKHSFEPEPRWILYLRDLPQNNGPARYLLTAEDGTKFERVFSKRKRQVIDGLLIGELFCASSVRIGDVVFRLKQDDNFHPETHRLSNGREYHTLPGKAQFLGPVGDGGAE